MALLHYTRRGTATVACDASLVYEVLTDYSTYSEWLPLVVRSKLLARERDLAIAEFELSNPPKDIFVVECINTTNKMVLWRKLRGKIPVSEIQWDIESQQGNQVRISLRIEGARDWPWVSRIYSRLTDTARCLRALQTYLSAFLPDAISGPDGEKLLEISETGEGLVCWLRGKQYSLVPRSDGHA